MSNFPRFKGLLSPTYTPMHEDGSIAPELVPALVDYLVRHRFAGLFVNGSTGEFTSLTMTERKLVAEAYVKAAAGRLPVIVNAASCCVADCCELAAHAARIGADAVCLIAPFYFRPATARDFADFIKSVVPAAGGLPIYLYHAPGITGSNLPLVDFLQIMLEEVPTFAGVKFTNENLYEFKRCIDLSDRIQMLFGKDEILLGALAMGAEAGIGTTYNYLPRIYQGVIEAFDAGKMEEARHWMTLSHRAVAISCRYGLPSIKTFMKFAGIDVGPMRLPVNRLSVEQENAFRKELSAAGLDPYIG